MKKRRELAPWKCDLCGTPLPSTGAVWSSRKRSSVEYRSEGRGSGYVCDSCASEREMGKEW